MSYHYLKTNLNNLLAAALVAGSLATVNIRAGSDPAQADVRGQAHYLFFCANCHGADGDGKGPYARLLKISPTNLTLLRQSGAQDVTDRVMNAITGRHEVGGGQEPKMPIFSENLAVETVYEITEYLKTIQQ